MNDEQGGFSDAEKKAMQERARELKAEARAGKKRSQGEQALRKAIVEMPDHDRVLAERFHALVSEAAPELWPRTWYGMPAYAREGKTVVIYFQGADKFEARYASFGFNDSANLDDGAMWPVGFALTKLDEATEATITELVKRALG
ncbi:MAG: hypothetical protein AB1Z67_06980 [Candidatus Limnocylindrales bacterium]